MFDCAIGAPFCVVSFCSLRHAIPPTRTASRPQALACGIADSPNPSLCIVGHVNRAVRTLRDPDRPIGRLRVALDRIRSCEAAGEDFVRARRQLALERYEADVEAVLRKRRAVPRPVERDEGTIPIFGGELRPGVE